MTGKRKSDRSTRRKLCSPGRPPVWQRETLCRFWQGIAAGLSSEEAGIEAGVSAPVGSRWFRSSGGMPPTHLTPSASCPQGRSLSFSEREEIALECARKTGVRAIARKLGRSPSTISREIRRNSATRSGDFNYRAITAQWHADRAAQRPKVSKLAQNSTLHDYVHDRLAGLIATPDGVALKGPVVIWKKRRAVHRQSRRWSLAWSPEQIAQRLKMDFPEDQSMRISHEAIYQALYIQGRGALKRELSACLRSGRALRLPRERARKRGRSFVEDALMISDRPAAVADRAVPGHWEGDLILGLGSSAIGTLVERTTRFTMLLHLPRMEGHGKTRVIRNGPALAGHGAQAVRNAIAGTIMELPASLRRSLTWDQGAEMAQHAQLQIDTGLDIYFCDPKSPWQRGSNENTNGLLRQYFPKGTDLTQHDTDALNAVAHALNTRPRKTLGWKTPAATQSPRALHPVIEIVGERRRAYDDTFRRRVVLASYETGQSVRAVARQFGVHVSVVYRWRQRLDFVNPSAKEQLSFVPVHMTPPVEGLGGDQSCGSGHEASILFPGGETLMVDSRIAIEDLRKLLQVLRS